MRGRIALIGRCHRCRRLNVTDPADPVHLALALATPKKAKKPVSTVPEAPPHF
jgi:hypothetical protein